MQITQDSVALIDYKLTNDAGDVIDSSEGGAPLAYLHGHSNMASANPEMLTSSHRVFDQSPLEDGGFV